MKTYVGRLQAVEELRATLLGERTAGRLTAQSIEGPGGIGKTTLFDHVARSSPMAARNYLVMRVWGSKDSAASTFAAVRHLIEHAEVGAETKARARDFFPSVTSVSTQYRAIVQDAAQQLHKLAGPDIPVEAVMKYFDRVVALGKPLNRMAPATQRAIDFEQMEKYRSRIEASLKAVKPLADESIKWLSRLGGESRAAMRNSLRHNALEPLAEALIGDLSAVLAGYRRNDFFKPTRRKVRQLDRLLLIIDDYELLSRPLGEFLVAHLMPKLERAAFESVVVVLGRDQLANTHPGWAQHLAGVMLEPIRLNPLSRNEVNELAAAHGVTSARQRNRVWHDTEGYPIYIQLWLEEIKQGGQTAVMLKRFHERTTRWMDDRERGWLEHFLFLDEVNLRTARHMLQDEEEARRATEWFRSEGSVRDTEAASFRVREYLRSRLIAYLEVCNPDRYEQLKALAGRLGQAA